MRISRLTPLFTLTLVVHTSPSPPRPYYLPNRLIALEEHAVSPSLEAEVIASGIANRSAPGTLEALKDVGAGRIAAMNAGHVSLAVLSQQSASGSSNASACREANDALHTAVLTHPTRFAAFAVLPMTYPDLAAAELERTVTHLGFKGAMLWNNLKNGTYYDSPTFHPVFAKAQDLDVPLYLHPAAPSPSIAAELFAGNYLSASANLLGTTAWGWHVDVGTHLLRLYSSGLFSRFPKLKIIIGHNGEGLPMFLDRIDSVGLNKNSSFAQVWETNVWVTTSAFFSKRALEQLRAVGGMGRVMYSVDYPFSGMRDGWEFVEEVARSGVLTREEMDGWAWGNAEELLRL
jgi:predicted TIM-barrel fold metal-dependent hydrolase